MSRGIDIDDIEDIEVIDVLRSTLSI